MLIDFSSISHDAYGNIEQPVVTLKTPHGDVISVIPAMNIKMTCRFNDVSEVTFEVPAYVEGQKTYNYDEISGLRLVEIGDFGDFVLINPEKNNEGGIKEIKQCTAYSLEYVFNYKTVDIGSGTYNFCNPLDNTDTIMGMIVEALPDWSIGDVDADLIGRWRTFEPSDDNWYSFMMSQLQQSYNCVFIFDTKNKRINVLSAARENVNMPIYLSFDNLMKSTNVRELSEEVVTVLSGYGSGEDVNIREVNPNGSNKIYNLDYFIARGDLPDDLADKWRQYRQDVRDQNIVYKGLYEAYREKSSQLMAAEAKATALQTKYDSTKKALTINRTDVLSMMDGEEKQAIEDIIAGLEIELAMYAEQLDDAEAVIDDGDGHGLKYDVEALNDQLNDVIGWIKIKEYFTAEELLVLSQYFIEDAITEDTFVLSEYGSATSNNLFGDLTTENLPTVTVLNSGIYAIDAFAVIEDIEGLDLDIELQQQLIEQLNNDQKKRSVEMRGGDFSFTYSDVIDLVSHSYDLHGDIVNVNFQYNLQNLDSYVDENSSDMTKKDYFVMSANLENAYIDDVPYQSMRLVLDGFITDATIGENNMVVHIKSVSYTGTGSVTEQQKQSVLQELYDYVENELQKLSEPSYEFSIDSANFLFADKFEPFKDALKLGDTINLMIDDDDDECLEPILIEVSFDFENENSLELVFSDKYRSSSHEFKLADLITEASHTARSVSLNKASYSSYADSNAGSQVRKMRDSALDVSKNKIINAADQNIEWNQGGIYLRKNTDNGFSDQQIAMINDAIVFTKDGWDTVEIAIGAIYDDNTGIGYGIAAPSIYGTLIAGENLVIENTVLKQDGSSILKQFKVDETGAWMNNTSLVFSHDGDPSHDLPGGKILIDPLYGIAAGNTRLYSLADGATEIIPSFIDENGNIIFDPNHHVPLNSQFYFDIRTGDAYFAGTLNAENVIAGTLNGMAITQNTLDGTALISGSVTGDKLTDGTITGAKIANATITGSQISGGTILGSHIHNGTITGTQIANSTITGTNMVDGTITGTQIALATIDESKIQNSTITGSKIANGTIDESKIQNSTITGSKIANGTIDESKIQNSTITGSKIANGTITGNHIQDSSIAGTKITDSSISGSKIDFSTFTNGVISGTAIDTSTFTNGSISGSAIDSSTLTNIPYAGIDWAHIDAADITTAWIQNGMIQDAAISDAQILGVSANKLTAGTIDASKINVANLHAKNLIVERVNGQPVLGGFEIVSSSSSGYDSKNPSQEGWYEFVNGQFVTSIDTAVDTSKVYYRENNSAVSLYDQDYIDNLVDDIDDRIDGAIETFTGDAVPTLNNYPAADWSSSQYEDHIGDVYYVINPESQADGYCYRFAYDTTTTTYSWILIKDSDVTAALQRLITAEGNIDGLLSFESTTETWITNTNTEIGSLQTRMTSAETSLGDKVDTTTFNEVKNTVDGNSAVITTLSNMSAVTPDGQTTTGITNIVNKVNQTATSNQSSITSLTSTVGNSSSGLVKQVSDISQDLNGYKVTVSETYTTISDFEDYQELNDAAVAGAIADASAAQTSASAAQTSAANSATAAANSQTAAQAAQAAAQAVQTAADNGEFDGRGIESTSVKYQSSTSNTQVPTGTWLDNPPAVPEGSYLWTRTLITYTDNTTSESYSVAKQGQSGTSPTVTNTSISYQQSTSGMTPPTGEWSPTPPAAIAEQYMWTRTVVTYSDNVTSTSYSVSKNGATGPQGQPGPSGQDGQMLYALCSTAADTADKVGALTPSVEDFTLQEGMLVVVNFTNTNSNSSATFNLNQTGAKPIRYKGAALTSTTRAYLAADRLVILQYDGTYWQITGATTDSNTNYYDRTAYKASLTASGAIPAGSIAVINSSGLLIPLSTTPFDTTGPILYVGTAYTTSALTQTNNYTMWGTPFALTTTKSGFSGTAGKPVFIKGMLNGKMFTPDSEVFTTTIPTAVDNKVYILLGTMSTTTNAVLNAEHPMYAYGANGFAVMTSVIASDLESVKTTYMKTADFNVEKEAITASISNVETTTKSYTDGKIAQEVSDRNAAITASADTITSRVAKTEAKLAGQYATSSSSAGTAAKEATITPTVTGWELTSGTTVNVKFINNNTTSSPTLNINGAGAKPIKTYNNTNLSEAEYQWQAGSTFTFTYNGTNWLMQDSTVATRISSAESTLTQHASSIDAKVSKDGVIASINLSAETDPDDPAHYELSSDITVDINKTYYIRSGSGTEIDPFVFTEVTPSGTENPTEEEWYEYYPASSLKIHADKVNIEGAALFTSGRLSEASLNADLDGVASSANAYTSSVASSAVAEEQYIYISMPLTVTVDNIAHQTIASDVPSPTDWIIDTTGRQNGWTIKRPEYDQSYPVLFISKQRKTVTGVVTNTPPMVDDTTTIIDGGRIITGSVTANQLAAEAVTAAKIAAFAVSAEKLNIGQYMKFEYVPNLLTSEPSDWSTNWKKYYERDPLHPSADEYRLIGGNTAPTWQADTYYWLEDDPGQRTNPRLLIGNKEKVAITIDGNQMTFWYNWQPAAYINDQRMVIPESIMLEEMKIGDELWSWKHHDQNLCLKWLGDK